MRVAIVARMTIRVLQLQQNQLTVRAAQEAKD